MKKSTRRLLGGLAIALGAAGTAFAYFRRRNMQATKKIGNVWARPGMMVTFRAELMPGRERNERMFRVKELLASGRVSLHGADGEHAEKEFEPLQIGKPTGKS